MQKFYLRKDFDSSKWIQTTHYDKHGYQSLTATNLLLLLEGLHCESKRCQGQPQLLQTDAVPLQESQ